MTAVDTSLCDPRKDHLEGSDVVTLQGQTAAVPSALPPSNVCCRPVSKAPVTRMTVARSDATKRTQRRGSRRAMAS